MDLSAPLTFADASLAQVFGETLIILDSRGTLANIRCLDLRTGEVRSMRLGLCEWVKNVFLSADGRRIVVHRPRSDSDCYHLGDFAVYTL